MKQNEESYLDKLLENVAIDNENENTYNTLLNNDADSFHLNEEELKDVHVDDFDQDFGDDLSFDMDIDQAFDSGFDEDFDSNHDIPAEAANDSFQSFSDISEDNDFDDIDKEFEQFKKDAMDTPSSDNSAVESNVDQSNADDSEIVFNEAEADHGIPDMITIPDEIEINEKEDDSPFEENLMESLLSETLDETATQDAENVETEAVKENEPVLESQDNSAEIESMDIPLVDNEPDHIEQPVDEMVAEPSLESEENSLGEVKQDENFDPMSDVEDLLGLLAQEEDNPELIDDKIEIQHASDSNIEEIPDDILSMHELEGQSDETSQEEPENLLDDSIQDFIQPEEEVGKKKKMGLFQRLFANIHDEKARKQNEWKGPVDEDGNPVKKQKKSKEEIKALKDAKKKEQDEIKKEKAAKAAEVKAQKAAAKQEKLEAKKEKQLQVVVEEDEGRINRVGATIVFLFFGLIAASIVFGTDSFSYSQSIKQATNYFGMQRYNSAYEEVRGIEVKDNDLEIYDKIMTVMFVNKQLNSYNNYYNMEMYPEALDSLLKGLQRYDEYITIAKELGIKSDLDYVRDQILGELNNIFGLNEKDCYSIIESDSQELYSQKVIQAASNE